MTAPDRDPAVRSRLQRFLAPRHAASDCAIMRWHSTGGADTPGADAECRLFIRRSNWADANHIGQAAFAAFGPPVVIACADWACEWLENRTIGDAQSLSIEAFEQALSLAPEERYAAVLVCDALVAALGRLYSV